MNRIINTLALATAGLVLLCGCSADPATDEAAPGGNDGKTVPVSFAAELPATRATIEIGTTVSTAPGRSISTNSAYTQR